MIIKIIILALITIVLATTLWFKIMSYIMRRDIVIDVERETGVKLLEFERRFILRMCTSFWKEKVWPKDVKVKKSVIKSKSDIVNIESAKKYKDDYNDLYGIGLKVGFLEGLIKQFSETYIGIKGSMYENIDKKEF